jgi:hypothetical protein
MFPNKLVGEADHNAMSIDPAHDIIVVLVHSRNRLCAIDPTHPGRPLMQLHSSTSKPRIRKYAAIEYSPNLHGFLYYSAADGAVIYKITPPVGERLTELRDGIWTWVDLLDKQNSLDPIADADRASAHHTNLSHTFGRFRIATYADIDVAILVRHVDSPVYAMRLT